MLRRVLLLASAVAFIDLALFAAVTPLLPELVDEFGLSKSAAGVLFAAYPAGVVCFAVPSGLLAARIGVRPTVVIGLLTMGVASLGFAYARSEVGLDLARFIQGAGSAVSWSGAFGWLAGAAPSSRRGEALGTAFGVAIVGSLTGPVLGAVAHEVGRELVFTTTALVTFSLIALMLGLSPTAHDGGSLAELRRATRDRQIAIGMWLVTLPGLIFGVMSVLVPLRLDALGAGAFVIGGAWVVAGLFEAMMSPFMGRWTDRKGRLLPATVGVAVSAVILLLLPWPDVVWLQVTLVVVLAPAVGVLWTPAAAILSDGAERHEVPQAFAFGLMNLGWASGETLGAAGGARLAEIADDAFPYVLLAVVCVITSCSMLRQATREGPPAASGASAG